MFSCFKKKQNKKNFMPVGGFNNDIVYYKFLNADTYALDLHKMQVWIFDKNKICIHASDNEFKAEFYIGKKLREVHVQEDVFNTFHEIHNIALTGVESKRTVMLANRLAYIEGRTMYYNEDVNDIYGTMLICIPYANVDPIRTSRDYKMVTINIDDRKGHSLEVNKKPIAEENDLKRSFSDSQIQKS
jgi:hypothetical protein